MDLNTLHYFIAAAKTEHMTRAAKQLNITQPTLSAAIRHLEAELGCSVFDRVGRNIRLNENGRRLLRAAEQVDEIMSSCMDELHERTLDAQSQVRVCCSVSPVNSGLVDALLEAGVPLHVDTIPADWEQALIRRECDFVITLGRADSPLLECVPLHNFRIVIACGARHPLAGAERLTVEDVNTYPFCTTGTNHAIYTMVKDQLEKQGLYCYTVTIGKNSADILRTLHTGSYLSLMVERNLPEGGDIVVLPVEGLTVSARISLYYLKNSAGRARLAPVRGRIIDFYESLPQEC